MGRGEGVGVILPFLVIFPMFLHNSAHLLVDRAEQPELSSIEAHQGCTQVACH
jgi:hypothetical protein